MENEAMPTEEDLIKEAKKRAEDKAGFFIHLAAYICVNSMFIAIWLFSDPDGFPFWIFMLFGWGIGVVAHYVDAFLKPDMMDKMVEKELRKLKGR